MVIKRLLQYLGLYSIEWQGKSVEDNLEMTRSEAFTRPIPSQLH
jgi:hypothetical protein